MAKRIALIVVFVGCMFQCALSRGTNAPTSTAVAPDVNSKQASRELLAKASELARDERWDEACTLFRSMLKTEPDDLQATIGLGTCLLQMRRYKEALDILGLLQERLPDDPALKNNIAWICAISPDPAIRNPAKAVRFAQQAILTMPGDADIWNTLAEAHFAAGEYLMAERAARIAVDIVQQIAPGKVSVFRETLRRCSKAIEHAGSGAK